MLKHLFEKSTLPSRVVILGSGGFVGAACQQRLETLGIPVLALPRTELDLTYLNAGELLADLLRPEDSLLFVSAKAPVKNESMLIENLQMASAVCHAVRKSPVQHLVYISSDAVYADSDGLLS
jgi:UDP-glucose 4-epimerase